VWRVEGGELRVSITYHPARWAPTPSYLPRYQGRTTFQKEGSFGDAYHHERVPTRTPNNLPEGGELMS